MHRALPCRPSGPAGLLAALARWASALAAASLVGCASTTPATDGLPAPEARAAVERVIPTQVPDRAGWAADVVAALSALDVPATPEHLCAVLAVTEQESTFRADPPVPRLGSIARAEIDRRAEAAGLPAFAVRAALAIHSSDGRSFAERIDDVKTERELSGLYEEFIDMVPLGRRLLADRNPVRTGGPMQVGIAFAQRHVQQRPYPYPVRGSLRDEVFTRRGGLYFGAAHLLDYEAPYPRMLFRFADFNAGRWASRNAAFQQALSIASGQALALDGDLLVEDAQSPGATERAALSLADRLGLSAAEIRRALARGDGPGFEREALHERVFALAERRDGKALPRAVVPRIQLKSPKITRPLTTEWFATRVDERHRRCMARVQGREG